MANYPKYHLKATVVVSLSFDFDTARYHDGETTSPPKQNFDPHDSDSVMDWIMDNILNEEGEVETLMGEEGFSIGEIKITECKKLPNEPNV